MILSMFYENEWQRQMGLGEVTLACFSWAFVQSVKNVVMETHEFLPRRRKKKMAKNERSKEQCDKRVYMCSA